MYKKSVENVNEEVKTRRTRQVDNAVSMLTSKYSIYLYRKFFEYKIK